MHPSVADSASSSWAVPPGASEPSGGPWRRSSPSDLVERLALGPGRRVVAVDGRSGSGKSSLADRLSQLVPRSAVVSTDDIAWHHSMFDWADLSADHVLGPFRDGAVVEYRPPGWVAQHREGAIHISADVTVLIVEGVGSSRRELAPLIDTAVWVSSDHTSARELGLARDVASGVNGDAESAAAFWDEWERAEIAFLEDDRPWERAAHRVAGVPLALSGIWLSD